jgi:RNA polymerase sigma-70 factor, ECF subfamily
VLDSLRTHAQRNTARDRLGRQDTGGFTSRRPDFRIYVRAGVEAVLTVRRVALSAMSGEAGLQGLRSLDEESQRWLAELRPDHPRRHEAVVRLRARLLRVARHELGRRRSRLGQIAGPEFDDLAEQAVNDAVVALLGKLDEFKGLSRFTTWAYKFVMFEVSGKVAAHAWKHNPPGADELTLNRLTDTIAALPDDQLEQREQLRLLAIAIERLTARQREVFVAVALNEVPSDVIALQLGSNRNAVYKNLFEARRRLREMLAEAGHPIVEETGSR